MKLIFLDVDGVLNWEGMFRDNGADWARRLAWGSAFDVRVEQICGHRLALYRDLLAYAGPDVHVCLSSSWRTSEDCKQALRHRGVRWHGETARAWERWLRRGAAIQEYIDNLGVVPDGMVILDDNPLVYDDDPERAKLAYLNDHWVKTDPECGLTNGDVRRALEILGVSG